MHIATSTTTKKQKQKQMKDSTLKAWLEQHGCLIENKKTDRRELTHVSMDGACLSIGFTEYAEFCKVYANGVRELSEDYFLCERPSTIVRMYCDFDFALTHDEITPDQFSCIVETLHHYVNFLYKETFDVYVYAAPCKRTAQRIKSGFHLVWKDLYVTIEQAKFLCKELVEVLHNTTFDTEDSNPLSKSLNWSTIVDISVYTSGLRLPGSQKLVRKRKEWVLEKRPYNLVYIFNRNGKDTASNEAMSLEDLLHNGSIRIYFPSVCALEQIEPFKYITVSSSSNTNNRRPRIDSKIMLETNLTDIPQQDLEDIHTGLVSFFNSCSVTGWHDLAITNLTKINEGLYLVATDSKYCLNLRDDHSSNHIFFVLEKDGLRQRCHCTCETLDKRIYKIFCKDFRSNVFPLPYTLRKKMFPELKLEQVVQTASRKLASKGKKYASEHLEPGNLKYMSNEFLKTGNYAQYTEMILRTLEDVKTKCSLQTDNEQDLSMNRKKQISKECGYAKRTQT